MSEGLRLDKMLFAAELADKSPAKVGTPSITISGNELKLIELMPRILNTGGLFNTPFGILTFTPAARPCNAWSKLCTDIEAISSPFMEATLPVMVRFC